jgi:hypothetical protein
MRIRLEYEDGPVFGTVRSGPMFGTVSEPTEYRALVVKIGGKPFTVWRRLDIAARFLSDDKRYIEQIDRALVAAMERMFEKVFLDACAAVPEGTDLMDEKKGSEDTQ